MNRIELFKTLRHHRQWAEKRAITASQNKTAKYTFLILSGIVLIYLVGAALMLADGSQSVHLRHRLSNAFCQPTNACTNHQALCSVTHSQICVYQYFFSNFTAYVGQSDMVCLIPSLLFDVCCIQFRNRTNPCLSFPLMDINSRQ